MNQVERGFVSAFVKEFGSAAKLRMLFTLLNWARENEEKAKVLLEEFNSFPGPLQRKFWRLLLRKTPEKAFQIAKRLRQVVEKAKDSGYVFVLPNGLKCCVRQLEQTPYAKDMLEYRAQNLSERARQAFKRYLAEKMLSGSYVFEFVRGEERFGLIYWVSTRTEKYPITLLRIVEKMQKGRPPWLGSELFGFYNGTFFRDTEKIDIIRRAIKENLSPLVSQLLSV